MTDLGDTRPASGDPRAARAAHLALFDVPDRSVLRRRLAAALPGAGCATRRAWTPDAPLRRHCVSVWFWRHGERELRERAPRLLREFVLPLLAERLPYCVGFPFSADVVAPRSLGFADVAQLDLEDIGTLLREGPRAAASLAGWAADGTSPAQPARQAAALAQLDERQRAAVAHALGPARVLAPAGSGKTKTLVSRVVELVGRGVDPGAILLLAFNRKAAEQLEERLAALGIATTRRIRRGDDAGPAAQGGAVHCATFNAFGARYQREVARAGGTLGGEHELRRLMGQAVRSVQEAAAAGRRVARVAESRDGPGWDAAGACLDALTRVRAGLEPAEAIVIAPGICPPRGTSARAQPPRGGGWWRRGSGRPEDGDCAETECAEDAAPPFAAIHDEYLRLQRRHGLQSFDDQIYFALTDMLADPAHRGFVQHRYDHVLVDEFQDLNPAQLLLVDILSRPRRDLFVVGDDDQLIYGWRLADIDGILGFHGRVPPRPWSATYLLATNYRCSREVIAASDRLIRHNRRREAKRIRPRTGATQGAVRFAGAPSWAERAACIVAFLREERARLDCDWRALAVLCRYRAQQLPLAVALDRAGIPRGPVEGGRLFTHPAADLLRRCLEQALTPATPGEDPRTAALRRRLTTGGVLAAADAVWATAEGFDLGGRWRAESARRARDAAVAGGEAAGDPDGDPFRVFDALLLLAGSDPLPPFLADWDRLAGEEARRLAGATAEAEPVTGIPEADGVAIGTIHAAKGREYRSVAIADYWCDLRHLEPAQLEEERRVLYVAVTRAQDAALLTIDSSRSEVHDFLRELGAPPVVTPGDTSHDAALPSSASPP